MNDLFPATNAPKIVRIWDCETTGRPEDEGAEVIELGRIDLNLSTYEIGNEWTSLAKPRGVIPPETMAVHHITHGDVADAPALASLWQPFFDGCGPNDVLAAHNAKFEQHFHTGNGRRWICTYKSALVVWPDAPGHGNQVLRYWLGLNIDPKRAEPPHRALPDAYVTAHILARLLQEKTVDELVHISKYPALLHRINFGTKAKGLLYSEAPADYLEWIAFKSDMNEDTKFTAKYWLKKRGQGK